MQECKIIIAIDPLQLGIKVNEILKQDWKVSGGITYANGMYMTLVVKDDIQ